MQAFGACFFVLYGLGFPLYVQWLIGSVFRLKPVEHLHNLKLAQEGRPVPPNTCKIERFVLCLLVHLLRCRALGLSLVVDATALCFA